LDTKLIRSAVSYENNSITIASVKIYLVFSSSAKQQQAMTPQKCQGNFCGWKACSL